MTNSQEFYKSQASVVRRSLPNFINNLLLEFSQKEKAAWEKFDGAKGRKEKNEARVVLKSELAEIAAWYEAEFSAWEKGE